MGQCNLTASEVNIFLYGQFDAVYLLFEPGLCQNADEKRIERRAHHQSVQEKEYHHYTDGCTLWFIASVLANGSGHANHQRPNVALHSALDADKQIDNECNEKNDTDQCEPGGDRVNAEYVAPELLWSSGCHTPRLIVLNVRYRDPKQFLYACIMVHASDQHVGFSIDQQ